MVQDIVQDYSQVESRKRPFEEPGDGAKTKRYNAGGNQPLLKLLVSNSVAGSLIGKGGSLMTEMKEKFGGNIRLSANRECYPGTNERIVVLTGEINEIIDLNNHIIEKVHNQSDQPTTDVRNKKVKIVLTNAAAGLLIGRGGATIKAIKEETKANLSISSIEGASAPGERVLTMSGTMDQCKEACRQVVEKISNDTTNMANTTLKYTSGGMSMFPSQESRSMFPSQESRSMFPSQESRSMFASQESSDPFSALYGNAMAALGGAMNMDLPHQGGRNKLKTKVEVQMEVPDALVGAILGKQGVVIRELSQRSGARFKFSDKNAFAEGTTDRILTITGDMNQAQAAYSLVNERVELAGNQLNTRR